MKEEKKKELFEEYLKTGNILVVDKSSASRRRLVKTIVDMGSSRNQVDSVAHFSEAIEIIDTKKPKLILSDYDLTGGSGFDLFQIFREKYPDEKKAVLVLVTSNISQSAVAKAAEEDVDSFVIKPYTVQSLEKSLITTVIGKLYPSDYVQTIEAGKEKLFAGDYSEALDIFAKAKTLNNKPSLAMFYHGQTQYLLEQMDKAEDDYKDGLQINSIHFKCQVGLYELFMKDEKFFEAYSVVKNIAKYFPANPDRLKEVIRLAITTEHFEDMQMYYEIFTQLDERPDDVINYVCSGMYIYGKFKFLNEDFDNGKSVFEKIGISCVGIAKFITAMIKVLAEYKFFDDAQKLVSRYSSRPEDANAYKLGNFIAYSNTVEIRARISEGLDLWNNGIKDPMAMKITIDALREDGSDKKAEQYLEEAQHVWPDIFKASLKEAA